MSPLTAYVVETLVTLLGVVALAVLVLYGARRLGVGRPGGPIDLVGRLHLDGRRAVYLVRVGDRIYVVGASEAGLVKLGEHEREGLELPEAAAPGSFAATLEQVRRRLSATPASPAPPSEAAVLSPPASTASPAGSPSAMKERDG